LPPQGICDMRTALSEATKINLTAILSETCRVLKSLIALRAISLLRKVRTSRDTPTAAS